MTEQDTRAAYDVEPIDLDATLTPVDVDRYLRRLNNALAYAEKELRAARKAEVDAEQAYAEAKQPYLLDPDCPDPSRSGVSMKAQEEWLGAKVPEQYWLYRRRKVVRMNAQDHAKRLDSQVRCIQSINSLVRQMYSLDGRHS
jgi:hypothetical protein